MKRLSVLRWRGGAAPPPPAACHRLCSESQHDVTQINGASSETSEATFSSSHSGALVCDSTTAGHNLFYTLQSDRVWHFHIFLALWSKSSYIKVHLNLFVFRRLCIRFLFSCVMYWCFYGDDTSYCEKWMLVGSLSFVKAVRQFEVKKSCHCALTMGQIIVYSKN